MTAPALEIRNLHKNFGAIQVANDINLALPRGARHALIGPNGAGKTTLSISLPAGCGPHPATCCSTEKTLPRCRRRRAPAAASRAPSK